MHRVLISDSLAPEGIEILRRTGKIEIDNRAGLKGEDLRAALAEADGVIIRSGTRLTSELLDGQKKLKVIVRAGVGVDNIDVPTATRNGIIVMNTPGGNTLSTAEQTIALMLAMCRHVPAADASLRGGKWDRKNFTGTQVAGKTIGVVGLGRVGQAVARRALGLEMKVLGYDPFLSAERATAMGLEFIPSVAEMLPRVDILTIHVPMTDETKNLIGSAEMAQMKKGSFIVNCARGGIIDEQALHEAIVSKHLAGAALDVFLEEPCTDSPLFKLPNVVVSPHLGAATNEAQFNVAVEAAELMSDFFDTGNVRFAVNMPSIDPKELADVSQSLDIAWRLGILQAQLARAPIRRATIALLGRAASQNTRLIKAGFAAGLLEGALEQQVNLVNAEYLAQERGIELVETTSSTVTDFHTLIRTDVETDQETTTASGTVRGTQYSRLVRLGPYRLDSFLDGNLILYHHQDKPGLIGAVGTICGEYNVNIAQMNVGRREPGGDALGVLAVDSLPPSAALEKIRKDPRISSVSVVKLPPFGARPAGLP
ncbi:phosphoglycerate dehydrogenase [bacterium]|jgi:D-3-phosphoglycerate dehydrogenase / 2-oxoglutarate reductase|nr:phosphoglycerate dehydrogenase [bacterium]